LQHIDKIIIYIDGSSQGNPGLCGVGNTFETAYGKKLLEISKFIGEGTNNQAEYQGLISALNVLKDKRLNLRLTPETEIEIRTDSELLYNQINGSYKVKDWSLKKLYSIVQKLKMELPNMKMVLIPREENRVCDKLAKKAIKDAVKQLNVKAKSININKTQSLFS
jgi:ribonuclease HI